MNHDSSNGMFPAVLAAQRCNSDVQLPYRFPIVAESHRCSCGNEKSLEANDALVVECAQFAQDAQAGYACNYTTERQPMAFNEVKEWCMGHKELGETVKGQDSVYVGKRAVTRLCSDAYGRGIVRGQVENANLRAYNKDSDATFAESIRTCLAESSYG